MVLAGSSLFTASKAASALFWAVSYTHLQPPAVDAGSGPLGHRAQKVLHDLLVFRVELGHIGSDGETVEVRWIQGDGKTFDVEPIPVRGFFTVLEHILKLPEEEAAVVEPVSYTHLFQIS